MPNSLATQLRHTGLGRQGALSLFGAALLTGFALSSAQAGTDDVAKMSKSVIEPEAPPSLIHGLINLELSDHYITPRGLDVENQGLIFQPLVLIFWDLYSSKTGFLNDVTLTTGVWNSWHTHASGADKGEWNEIDPTVGLTFKFAKDFQFDAFYTAFKSQTNSYETSTNLDLKLTYHDHFMGDFSINPYVEWFKEIAEKATVAFDYSKAPESYYFSIGIDPTYSSKACPVKVELPTFINLVDNGFYQKFDGSHGGSGLAVFSTELKVSMPLNFIPKGYGSWTIYAGYQYYHLSNTGLLDGNVALGATSERLHNIGQVHGGLTIFF